MRNQGFFCFLRPWAICGAISVSSGNENLSRNGAAIAFSESVSPPNDYLIRSFHSSPPCSGRGGAFLLVRRTVATAHLFIDYQNLHMSAYELFAAYGAEKYDSLIHPAKFGDQTIYAREAASLPAATLEKIHVFRGLPSRKNEPNAHARNQRQASNWTRDRRVQMYSRPLRYPRDWPDERAQEKGIDVMLGITVVQAAIEGWADHLIICTRDTDLVPAFELAHKQGSCAIELVGWEGMSQLVFDTGKVAATFLKPAAYRASRDTRQY